MAPTNTSRQAPSKSDHGPKSGVAPLTTAKAFLKVTATTTDGYEVPVIHLRLPERAVNMGFWGALVGSAALGAIDPPLAILIGLGVVIARHRNSA